MTAGRPAPVLDVRGLRVAYGDRVALHDVNVAVGPGELVGLAGPNGSGKSTLLRAALGLLTPAGGTVRLSGAPVEALTPRQRARLAAWMPQSETPQENVTVEEYVLFGRYARVPPLAGEGPADHAAVRSALRSVDLLDRRSSGILELSGGERQRALLARALAQDAPLLLLDEPTAHLDIGHQLDLLERVRSLSRERGTAIVAALHDLNLAARYADRILVLSRGRLVDDGPPTDVLSPRTLREVWGVVAELQHDPATGHPYLIPTTGPPEGRAPSRERGPVHVVGGGGTASPVLVALDAAGWRVSAGVLPLFDTDTTLAQEMRLPCVVGLPFAAVTEEARRDLRALLADAQAVVVAPIPVGPGNVANLEEVARFAGRVPVLLLEPSGWEGRDFTGGRATELRAEILARGGEVLPSVARLVGRLAGLPSAVATRRETPRDRPVA